METYFEASFEKDLKKLKDRTALQMVKKIIAEVKQAKTIRDIANLKKLNRMGSEITNDTVIFVRCLHRKDMYRYFPKE